MDAGVRHEIRLEFIHVNVECAVEAERGCDGGDDLRDEAVEVDVAGGVDVESVEDFF